MNDTAKTEALAHSPESAARRLGTTTRAIYYLIANGELRSFKLGKRRLIPDKECERLVQRKMTEAAR